MDPDFRLDQKAERIRYELHQNSFNDPGYTGFLLPLLNTVLSEVHNLVNNAKLSGLDFGSGRISYFKEQLESKDLELKNSKKSKANNIEISLYDPYFWPAQETLKNQYDFVICSEAMEHFYYPKTEFATLKKILKSGGFLAFMSHFYDDKIDFESWFYRRDPTHVSFYSRATLMWICEHIKFQNIQILSDRIAVLYN